MTRADEYDIKIIVVTTCISIIFMLNMKISDNSAWVNLPADIEREKQEMVMPPQLNENVKSKILNDNIEEIDGKEKVPSSLGIDNDQPEINNVNDKLKAKGLNITKPSWEEVKKRVEDKGVPDSTIGDRDISTSELNYMIKNLSSDDKMECINILTKLKPGDIMSIINIYKDGVTLDEERAVRDILKKDLNANDFMKLMNVAEKIYVKTKSK